MNLIKKVLLITSSQPSLNPRLVKEADALANEGYEVTVMYAYWNAWGTKFDTSLIPKRKWKALRIGGDPEQQPQTYFLSRVIHHIAKIAAKKITLTYFAELAIARTGYMLIKASSTYNADIYIAHNLAALPAAVKAAKLHNRPCGFDAEDFHRNEASNNPKSFDVKLKTYLENKYIPQTNYLTASSPQIADKYKQLFPEKNPVTILNVFNTVPSIKIRRINDRESLKLFWFSQTIGSNRGIEEAIIALNTLNDNRYELHLLGNLQQSLNTEYFEELVNSKSYSLHFHDPIASEELIPFAAQFDIGLALEPSFSINNDIALSNKIFTYLQAGLALVASNTTAQSDLLRQNPDIGKVYEMNNVQSLANILRHYSQNRIELLKAKQASLSLAQKELNWEQEQLKFLRVVNKTLAD